MVKRLADAKRSEALGESVDRRDKNFFDMKGQLLGSGDIIVEDVKGREGDLLDIEKDAMSR